MHRFKTVTQIILISVIGSALTACGFSKSSQQEYEHERMINTAKINCQLGLAYLQSNNIPRAKQKLLLAISQAPTAPEPLYSMAYFLEVTGDKTQAGVYYSKAVKVAPKRGDAQNNYGTYLCRNGQYAASIKYFLAAAKNPDYLDVGDAYENAGLCALKIPDNQHAIQYFSQALMRDPSRKTSLYEIAEAYYQSGNYREARIGLNHFLEASPPTAESLALSVQIDKKLCQNDPNIISNKMAAIPEKLIANNNVVTNVINAENKNFTVNTKVESIASTQNQNKVITVPDKMTVKDQLPAKSLVKNLPHKTEIKTVTPNKKSQAKATKKSIVDKPNHLAKATKKHHENKTKPISLAKHEPKSIDKKHILSSKKVIT